MARGDFGKAFAAYRKSGGLMSRKEFALSELYQTYKSSRVVDIGSGTSN
jgi:hypothetical protein